jgi:sporulation protein YqfC
MKKTDRWARIADLVEMPAEALLNLSRVEIVGRLQVRVENHRGVKRYQPNQVVLDLPEGCLIIDGQGLVIGWVDQDDLLVTGRIQGVRYEGGRDS